MYPSSWLACLPFLAPVILAAAPPPSILQPRQEAPSSPPAGSPGIFAKVSSPNGTDLTSNFQVLVYHHDNRALSNLTDRNLEDRQVPGTYRAIVSCQNPEGQFQTSVCDYFANRRTSLQRWIVECRVLGGRNGRRYRRVLEGVSKCFLLPLLLLLLLLCILRILRILRTSVSLYFNLSSVIQSRR